MPGPLNWQQIAVPSFNGVADNIQNFSNLLSGAFTAAKGVADKIDTDKADAVNNAIMAKISGVTDPTAAVGAPADILAGLNQNDLARVRASTFQALNSRPGELEGIVSKHLANASGQADFDQTQLDRGHTNAKYDALQTAAPAINKLQLLSVNGTPEQIAAYKNSDEFKQGVAGLDPTQLNAVLTGGFDLEKALTNTADTRLSYDKNQYGYNQLKLDDAEKVNVARLVNDLRPNGVDSSDYEKLFNTEGIAALRKQGYTDREIQAGRSQLLGETGGSGNGGVGSANSGSINTASIAQMATGDNISALTSAAQQLGTTPEDLATVISYETGGKFDPNIVGGKGNNYQGLIQFGPAERAKYGIKPGMSFAQQMPAVVAFLKDRGYKPGMGLLDLYSTINAGSPGHYDASDGNGTVRDHVAQMIAQHSANAKAFLGAQATGTKTDIQNNISGDPNADLARTFLEVWNDKTPARAVAASMVGKDGILAGEDVGVVNANISRIQNKYKVSAAVAGRILAQAAEGDKGMFNYDTFNPFDKEAKTYFNWDKIDQLGKLASNYKGLRQAAVGTEAQANSIGGIDQARAAFEAAQAAVTNKLNRAQSLGRHVNMAPELMALQQAQQAYMDAIGQSRGLANAGMRPGVPAPPPAPKPVVAQRPAARAIAAKVAPTITPAEFQRRLQNSPKTLLTSGNWAQRTAQVGYKRF